MAHVVVDRIDRMDGGHLSNVILLFSMLRVISSRHPVKKVFGTPKCGTIIF